jgi:hypothetical protein
LCNFSVVIFQAEATRDEYGLIVNSSNSFGCILSTHKKVNLSFGDKTRRKKYRGMDRIPPLYFQLENCPPRMTGKSYLEISVIEKQQK